MECCINVEDLNIFLLLLGKIICLYVLGGLGVCWDLYIYLGYVVFLYYDLMIGKLIIFVENCDIVICCME